jgi:hypothetical protein
LFLDDLYEEFRRAVKSGPKKKFVELRAFQDKLAGLKFLDPACGCGNFLVITYRELRRLEHKVVATIASDPTTLDMFVGSDHSPLKVNVDQMYGIEIEEFPSLIAQTALWLTDHQMNMEYSKQSTHVFKRIPLTASATIINDNALTKDWAEVVAPSELDYILGNPPFIGSKMMTSEMRDQLLVQFMKTKGAGVLDFVTAWYAKAAQQMKLNPKIQTALVSTNSIIQGEQVPILWKYLFDRGVSINFLHQTFKWNNEGKTNAAVYCTIVGFALFDKKIKHIYEYEDIEDEPVETKAKNINGYGIDAPSFFIERRGKPISEIPLMSFGNMPLDGGNLLLTDEEKIELVSLEPTAEKFIKPLIGAREFIHNEVRWCLWLEGANPSEMKKLPLVIRRVQSVREFRLGSKRPQTIKSAVTPSIFGEVRSSGEPFVLIPRHSSENRNYVPIGMIKEGHISHDSCLIVLSAKLYHFGVLTSQMHMAWMRAVAGRLESRYRYSKDIVYNNFIWPEADNSQTSTIEKLAQAVLDARLEFPNASLADLYDPLTMPPVLAKAHKALDRAVDKLYQQKSFATDADRVAHLFQLYQQKTTK